MDGFRVPPRFNDPSLNSISFVARNLKQLAIVGQLHEAEHAGLRDQLVGRLLQGSCSGVVEGGPQLRVESFQMKLEPLVRANRLAALVTAFDAEWIKEEGGLQRLDKLLAMAERESRAVVACARSMRLTQQSQILPRGAGRANADKPDGPKPWDRGDGYDHFFNRASPGA
jgi:hypothetical protein